MATSTKEVLEGLIAKMSEREFPTEEQLAKRGAMAAKMQRENRAVVNYGAYLKHLPDRHARFAKTPPQEKKGNEALMMFLEEMDDMLSQERCMELVYETSQLDRDTLLPGNKVWGRNLFLWGPRGTGKTHAACWIAGALIKQFGVSARFWEWPALILEMTSRQQEPQALPDLLSPEVLILDDLDKRGDAGRTSYAGEFLFTTLRRLDMAGKTTIITSNRSPAQTAKLFYTGDRSNQAALASRLTYYLHSVHVGGEDGRL
jgi:DNA replication protein DnaC